MFSHTKQSLIFCAHAILVAYAQGGKHEALTTDVVIRKYRHDSSLPTAEDGYFCHD